MLDVVSAVGLVVAMFVVVPVVAYGLSALVDRIARRDGDDEGEEGRGGSPVPQKPAPSGPPASAARSAELKTPDGTDQSR